MQNNPYPLQPADASGQPLYPIGQPYPPYGVQPQPYYPAQPQQANPNQTYVVVNTSQKVNTGATWMIWLGVGLALLLCIIFTAPAVVALIGAMIVENSGGHSQVSGMASTGTGSQHHKVGETIYIIRKNGATCTMVVNSAQVEKNTSSDTTYLVLELAVHNTGNSVISPNFLDFKLIDTGGQIARADSLMIPSGKHLLSGEVQPGGTTNGLLVFAIQPGQHNFTLSYDASSIGETGYTYGWDLQI